MRRRVFGIRLSRLLIVVGGFFAIASVIAVALIFVVNDTRAAINADRRIREAFGSIQVHHPTAGGGGGTSRISQFMYRIEGQGRNSTRYSSVSMHIDVGQMLASSGVEADDFNRARAHFYEYQSELYRGLGEIFAVTDDLFITLRQLGDDEIEYYNLPPDVAAMNHFDLNISNFLDSDEKIFRLDTDFGKLILHSSFFFGRISDSEMGLVSNLAFAQDPDAEVVLRFGYEENGDEITVQLEILDQDGEPIHLEFPGRSMLIALPLSLDFMRGSQGRIFDAVEYVDPVRSAILPRSFRDDSYLYILTNRTGMFRLITTEHGTTINQAETSAIHLANFLYDRGIDPEGMTIYIPEEIAIDDHEDYPDDYAGDYTEENSEEITTDNPKDLPPGNYQTVVSRGEFFNALMGIHWVEGLRREGPLVTFPDVSPDDPLALALNVGRSRGILWGVPTSGSDVNPFLPGEPLRRSHLFLMLDRYVSAFEVEVNGLMPQFPRAQGLPDGTRNRYWYDALHSLRSIGFMPYRIDSYGARHVAGNAYLQLDEAREILFRLVTARDMFDRW